GCQGAETHIDDRGLILSLAQPMAELGIQRFVPRWENRAHHAEQRRERSGNFHTEGRADEDDRLFIKGHQWCCGSKSSAYLVKSEELGDKCRQDQGQQNISDALRERHSNAEAGGKTRKSRADLAVVTQKLKLDYV